MSALTQFYYRAPKSVGIIQGTPSYEGIDINQQVTDDVRVTQYSSNGKYFAFTQSTFVTIINPDDGSIVNKIELKDVFDLQFSPQGSYLCTWEKPLKQDDGNYHNNVKIFTSIDGQLFGEYSARDQSNWKPDFTPDENLIARQFKNEIKFYEVNSKLNFNKAWSSLKIENLQNFKLSPGKNPKIAVFKPEKSGKPAIVSVYNITQAMTQPVSSKTFFKAERCTLRWNNIGTALLALASTDVDASNKSYYGETTLYLLGIAGSYDSRIHLDKEGPIHDITWSPSAREFGVVYGYMPAKTTFFDARGNTIYSLPPAPKNTILFSPHARFVLVAGFGNLQGTVDVYDRLQKFSKISSFSASNTSVCQWSPDGRYILTATTSPRLRVDNGVKVWYATGKLIFNKDFKELFAVDWRPRPLETFPPLKKLDDNPSQHSSVLEIEQKNPKPISGDSTKPKGAYRPPHQRNGNSSSTPQSLYQKEISSNLSGTSYQPPTRTKLIPGAPKPVEKESKSAAKNRKKRENKQKENSQESTPTLQTPPPSQPQQPQHQESLIVGGTQSLEEKKIRGLLKKLRAIEALKMKQAQGETLEDTQVLKIQTEDKIRSELSSLGWNE
ncbi:Eukaryotic translation initiation factor 2A [Wickerhamomyces ciferrii]|uniref:Eukaryotic translation initiation factor 2A n=1 Tax=Wickerhamomyces ciferrii (strain ATCC 14091 / BCRC 22168 / CBS 111 / JCM 3599 / NBRC 0793 / NRRL Y-1031 F-60-10) TaxID=1206466 RepID=K0KHG1_WICCF|nr:Eukaryotic translation initiation factor 2A [Wickerhamomyces ciferrii]CCH42451.1 Eukaryotic translation initiation factor 2A [Wickerhamomyces ciferrii]